MSQPSTVDQRPTAAFIGAGVSGLTAAHLPARTHSVTLYEAKSRLGGYAPTHDVADPSGRSLAVDTICDGWERGQMKIVFPRPMAVLMKTARLLPVRVWAAMMGRAARK